MLATLRRAGRHHPRAVTVALSAVGYALVLGVLLADGTVLLFGDLIAVVNTAALTCLLAGYWFVRRGEVWRHRAAMLTAFTLILVFLVLYLWKVGGGFTKEFVGPAVPRYLYFGMLAVHVVLSVVSMPVVLHAVVLGLTHDRSELPDTIHPRVGRVAVGAWSLSLFLGVVTYLMLNHLYAWERAAALLL
jgi:putative membrane protein